MPASTAQSSVGAGSRPTKRAVSQAQPSQVAGPTNQPQLSKKPCEKTAPSSSESTATATSCTTATRQKTSNLTPAVSHSGDRAPIALRVFHNQQSLGG